MFNVSHNCKKNYMNRLILISLIILTSCQSYDKSEINKVGIYNEISNLKIIDCKVLKDNVKDTIRTKYFKYNNKGQLVYSKIISNKINNVYITEYIYNSKGELIKEITKGNEIKEPIIVEYNIKNDTLTVFQCEIFEKDDNVIYKISGKESYNSKKEKETSESKNFYIDLLTNDTINISETKDFYKNGFVYIKDWISYDTLMPSTKYEYFRNRDNLVIKIIETKENNEFESTMEYEFDNFGSWIKQSVFENGELIRIKEREIEYKK